MNETKRCPYCGEEIMASAKKCRHCGEWLVDKKYITPIQSPQQQSDQQPVNKKDDTKLTGGVIAFAAIMSLLYYGFIPAILMIIAYNTVPSEAKHNQEIVQDMRDCVSDQANSIAGAFGGDEARGIASLVFSTGLADKGIIESFSKNNTIIVDKHWFWSVGKICNRNYPEGTTVSFGMFGFVIPFVSWDDFVLTDDKSSTTESDSHDSFGDQSSSEFSSNEPSYDSSGSSSEEGASNESSVTTDEGNIDDSSITNEDNSEQN